MKKVFILLILLSVLTVGVFAEQADYFTFTMGSGGGYDMSGSNVVGGTVFGVDYTFNSGFSGGFKYFDIDGNTLQIINMTMIPADKMKISVYSGTDAATDPTVGIGVGYDIFTKKDALFSNLSINVDWFATTRATSTFDIADGGVIFFGLRSQVGL
ncbi:MAG: hypothetical protein PF693_03790 [Spirochaetia bacterium]|jgi:hypothetical protein|nr:hypothetical protein [Spirochaetia bacterium]